MKAIKLLPCPFCGTIPELPKRASVVTKNWATGKETLTAGNHCPGCYVSVLGKRDTKTHQLAVKEAARVWNTRVSHGK